MLPELIHLLRWAGELLPEDPSFRVSGHGNQISLASIRHDHSSQMQFLMNTYDDDDDDSLQKPRLHSSINGFVFQNWNRRSTWWEETELCFSAFICAVLIKYDIPLFGFSSRKMGEMMTLMGAIQKVLQEGIGGRVMFKPMWFDFFLIYLVFETN